jgi:hypothetical protein
LGQGIRRSREGGSGGGGAGLRCLPMPPTHGAQWNPRSRRQRHKPAQPPNRPTAQPPNRSRTATWPSTSTARCILSTARGRPTLPGVLPCSRSRASLTTTGWGGWAAVGRRLGSGRVGGGRRLGGWAVVGAGLHPGYDVGGDRLGGGPEARGRGARGGGTGDGESRRGPLTWLALAQRLACRTCPCPADKPSLQVWAHSHQPTPFKFVPLPSALPIGWFMAQSRSHLRRRARPGLQCVRGAGQHPTHSRRATPPLGGLGPCIALRSTPQSSTLC